ncbi:MAG TPA: COP23 domain-containing protein [Leptolyngbyaceae cyanobacterium]
MKTLSCVQISGAIAFSITTAFSQPTVAQNTTFLCGTSNGVPATIVRTPEKEVPMILWNSPNIALSGSTPQKLCQEVSSRLQTHYKNDTLKYITTQFKSGQVVVCVAEKENEPCSGEPLFTLNTSGATPGDTLQRIFRIRVASAAPISETQDRLYISLDRYLNGEYPSLTPVGRRTPPSQPINSRDR